MIQVKLNNNNILSRKQASLALNVTAVAIYGFALGWHKLSNSSAELYIRSDPGMRVYGKWRFLTYNCLIIQFVACLLSLTSHFMPSFRKTNDFFFTTYAFPIGMLVVSSFWSIWFLLGREHIFPTNSEEFYPPWLNHTTHTIIAPINLLAIILNKHHYSTNRKSISSLFCFIIAYTTFVLYIKSQSGRYVYPFLNKMEPTPALTLMACMALYTVSLYKFGQFLNNLVHKNNVYKVNYNKQL